MTLLPLVLALAVPSSAAPMTDKQLAKLSEGLEKSGSAMVPGDQLLVTLGLPKDKKAYTTKYRARIDDPKGGPTRYFGRKPGGDCLLSVGVKDGVKYLRFDPAFKLEGSAWCRRGASECVALDDKEAAALLEAELAFWAGKAGAP
jgi:hypothetical protein